MLKTKIKVRNSLGTKKMILVLSLVTFFMFAYFLPANTTGYSVMLTYSDTEIYLPQTGNTTFTAVLTSNPPMNATITIVYTYVGLIITPLNNTNNVLLTEEPKTFVFLLTTNNTDKGSCIADLYVTRHNTTDVFAKIQLRITIGDIVIGYSNEPTNQLSVKAVESIYIVAGIGAILIVGIPVVIAIGMLVNKYSKNKGIGKKKNTVALDIIGTRKTDI